MRRMISHVLLGVCFVRLHLLFPALTAAAVYSDVVNVSQLCLRRVLSPSLCVCVCYIYMVSLLWQSIYSVSPGFYLRPD